MMPNSDRYPRSIEILSDLIRVHPWNHKRYNPRLALDRWTQNTQSRETRQSVDRPLCQSPFVGKDRFAADPHEILQGRLHGDRFDNGSCPCLESVG